jgi:hypothetical protein
LIPTHENISSLDEINPILKIMAAYGRFRRFNSDIYRIVLLSVFLNPTAKPQLVHGSFVAVAYSQQKIIFAGDSRVVGRFGFDNRTNDMECKVSAPQNKFIFFAVGFIGFETSLGVTTWSSVGEANRLADGPYSGLKNLADQWVLSAQVWLRSLGEPDLREIRKRPEKALCQVGFAGRDPDDTLKFIRVTINKVDTAAGRMEFASNVKDVEIGRAVALNFVGRTEIADEFAQQWTDRAVAERKKWKLKENAPGYDEFLAIRLVDLTSALHPRQDVVGGPTDAIEVRSNGRIRWIRRKPNCAAD